MRLAKRSHAVHERINHSLPAYDVERVTAVARFKRCHFREWENLSIRLIRMNVAGGKSGFVIKRGGGRGRVTSNLLSSNAAFDLSR